MTDVVVIGGGFAGLGRRCGARGGRGVASRCSRRRPHLGGRAHSFRDDATDTIVDNGQHAMMGCYADTLAFLDRIGGVGESSSASTNLHVEMHDPRRGTRGDRVPAAAEPAPHAVRRLPAIGC